MELDKSLTLPDLLRGRRGALAAKLNFLDAEGRITRSLSYAQLYEESLKYAARLVLAGLRTDGSDVVLAHFTDHESHIRTFWACCLANIRVCPIPLHPDPNVLPSLFEHLRKLFNNPTFISTDEIVQSVLSLVPTLKTLSTSRIESVSVDVPSRVLPQASPEPDDIAFFMLTSGSTGNSKAVGLSHSNILTCVRGKAKCHDTTSSSSLLNWIAFDHVACISDVHLQALVVDARQYHIAPTAIIANPPNLLNICSRYEISYTFSPNFLLAQICHEFKAAPYPSNSINLSFLKAFISGGEAVPVKTAVEFTDILEQFGASRDVLRGGFGMTETCAGCIFDTRQIPRDVKDFNVKYLSLGKCCDGVFLRIMDPKTGSVCVPLQVGQLQLQGPTVFRGYHNNPRANAESFSDGWFVTGDTASLDEDGNLHMMGRDKDYVNINGVKHPSVDVECYIEELKIDGVMKLLLYVCPMRLPNADTETYAVFYQHEIVVEDILSATDRVSIAATNRAIKGACVVFVSQAPYIVLPLPRKSFVKTALGKISRSALVAAYLNGQYEEIEKSLVIEQDCTAEIQGPKNAMEEIIFDCIATVLGKESSSLNRSHNLFDMGASSMHLMQLKQRLQTRLSILDIPPIELLRRPELGKLSDYIAHILHHPSGPATGSPSREEYDPLGCLNSAGTKPPLFLIHPGMGEVLVFAGLAKVLADDRPVYALRARGFNPDQEPFTSWDDMTDSYTSAIEKAYPSGPYYIAGYSFGGIVAFEIGKKLIEHGKRVAWLGSVDAPPRFEIDDILPNWIGVLVMFCWVLELFPDSELDSVKAALEKKFPEILATDSEPSSALEIFNWIFMHCNQERLAALQLSVPSFMQWVKVADGTTRMKFKHKACGTVPGALMTVFWARGISASFWKGYSLEEMSEWQEFSTGRNLEMVDIDGSHYTCLSDDHVESFAERLREALAQAERAFIKVKDV